MPKQLFFYDIRFGVINILSIMKNLFVIILSAFTFSFAYSQDRTATFTSNTSEYQKNKANGVYVFNLDGNEYNVEKVKKAASYYKDYFIVTPKKKNDKIEVQVSLKGVNQENINILKRFFVSLEIKEVNYKNEVFDVHDFTSKYL